MNNLVPDNGFFDRDIGRRYFSAVGFLLIGFDVTIKGAFFLIGSMDLTGGIFDIDPEAYRLSISVIAILNILCVVSSLARGLITESILFVFISTSTLISTMDSLIGAESILTLNIYYAIAIWICSFFFYLRKNYLVSLATFLNAIVLLFTFTGDWVFYQPAAWVMLMIGGFIYMIFGADMIVYSELGITRLKRFHELDDDNYHGVAQNSYEIACSFGMFILCVQMAITGLEFLTESGDLSYAGSVAVTGLSIIMIPTSAYICIKNIAVEGLFTMIVSVLFLLANLDSFLELGTLPKQITVAVLLPLVFFALLCLKKRYMLIASIAGTIMLSELAIVFIPGEYSIIIAGNLFSLAAMLTAYYSIKRWYLIETRRRVRHLAIRHYFRRGDRI